MKVVWQHQVKGKHSMCVYGSMTVRIYNVWCACTYVDGDVRMDASMPWCTCTSAENSLHNCTCSVRAVYVHFFGKKNWKKNDFFFTNSQHKKLLLIKTVVVFWKQHVCLPRMWTTNTKILKLHNCTYTTRAVPYGITDFITVPTK